MSDSLPPPAAIRDRATPIAVIGHPPEADGLRLALPGDGARMGRFVLLDQVGEGAMGLVYSAYDELLDRKVAIKLIRETDNAEDRLRIRREAQAMARLSHPHVAQIYEAGEVGERLYMAMEFVPGDDLNDWQSAERRPWRDVLAMYTQVGQGLAAAHAAGILHRDFKPHNVLIGADGRPRVIDFGLARAPGVGERSPVDRDEDVRLDEPLTRVGTVMGTPAYMALEQFQGRPLDARADQFAFCVALYEALYGQSPYPRSELGALLAALQTHRVAPPPDVGAPPWLFDALRRGLHPDPEARWPSLDDLLEELGRDRELDPATGRNQRLLFVGGVGLMVVISTVIGRVANGWDPPGIEQSLIFALMVQFAALVGLLIGRRAVLSSAFNRRIAAYFFAAISTVLGARLMNWAAGIDRTPQGIELAALTALTLFAAATTARWFAWMALPMGIAALIALVWPPATVAAYTIGIPLACTVAVYFTLDRRASRGVRRRSTDRPAARR